MNEFGVTNSYHASCFVKPIMREKSTKEEKLLYI